MKFLITGISGFLGQKLAKSLISDGYKVLGIARNEGELVSFKEKFPEVEIYTGDISDTWTVRKAMKGVDGVFHLAAFKHVGLAEEDVMQCVKSNVFGTMRLLAQSYINKPKFFISISTDKAAQVSGVYGASKFLMERLMGEAERINPQTKYRVVRYGNVLGSTGSFITKWKTKMEKGEEIILTDPTATRFFWSAEDAIKLIFECLDKAEDVKPWVPEMKAISMGDALQACQSLWGTKSPVRIIGLQEGENLHETMGSGVFSNEVPQYSVEEFAQMIKSL